jgi:hypothetical protein
MSTLEALEKRIQALEDQEAIKRLKAKYAQLCDARYDARTLAMKSDVEVKSIAREIANLFTEDAVWDGGEKLGIARGKEEIYERFVNSAFRFAVHYFVMPDIRVEGNKAKARWYLFQAATNKENLAVWMSGVEDDEYAKIHDQWLQTSMKVTIYFLTPYDQGWTKRRLDR